MRVPSSRLRAVVVATLAATLILSVIGPAVSAAKGPPGLGPFMYAMGKVESGGNHNARNAFSGAVSDRPGRFTRQPLLRRAQLQTAAVLARNSRPVEPLQRRRDERRPPWKSRRDGLGSFPIGVPGGPFGCRQLGEALGSHGKKLGRVRPRVRCIGSDASGEERDARQQRSGGQRAEDTRE